MDRHEIARKIREERRRLRHAEVELRQLASRPLLVSRRADAKARRRRAEAAIARLEALLVSPGDNTGAPVSPATPRAEARAPGRLENIRAMVQRRGNAGLEDT